MLSHLYSGRDSEQKALRLFCQNVLADAFWPFEEFLLSLKIPQTYLIYRSQDPQVWQGFALGRVMGGVSELFFIFIRSEERGRGLAQLILKEFEDYGQGILGAESVLLEVRVGNASAIRLYEKSGYERIHTRKRYYQDGEDAYVYSKQLCDEGSIA